MALSEKHQYRHKELPFFAWAARRFQFRRKTSSLRSDSSHDERGFLEKNGLDPILESSDTAGLDASKAKASIASDAVRDNLDRRRHVRSLPPWIHSLQEDEVADIENFETGNIAQPSSSVTPHRNHTPAQKHEPKHHAPRGRMWDHARSGAAVTPSFPLDHESKWYDFIGSSAYAWPKNEEGEIVDDDWVKQNVPDLDEPYASRHEVKEPEKDERLWLLSDEKRSATFRHFQSILMKNPFVPLLIRLTVMAFCLVALGLGVQIWRRSESLNNTPSDDSSNTNNVTNKNGDYICKQQASTYMAFIVDSCAVVYLIYITYDEYFSKPLGLRSSKDKMRLLFLDLLFIIFSAANLSLAFNTLTDQQWSCYEGSPGELNLSNAAAARSTCVTSDYLCDHQAGLVSVLLVAEVAWVMTFAISVLRIVERIQR